MPTFIYHTQGCLPDTVLIVVLLNDSVMLAALSVFSASFCLGCTGPQPFLQKVFKENPYLAFAYIWTAIAPHVSYLSSP